MQQKFVWARVVQTRAGELLTIRVLKIEFWRSSFGAYWLEFDALAAFALPSHVC
jgi:hypothetical protein